MAIIESFLSDAEALDFRLLHDDDLGSTTSAANRSETQIIQRMLALALRQVTDLALLICTSASIVNWLNRSSCEDTSVTRLLMQLPGAPTFDRDVSQTLVHSNIPIEIIVEMQTFYMHLAAVRAMSVSFCECPADLTIKGGVHIEALAGGWRDLAGKGRALIFQLLELLRGSESTSICQQLAPQFVRVQSLLAECADGASPCVMADGTVEIPEFGERRQDWRYTVDWSAIAYSDSGAVQVRIVDVSLGGLRMLAETAPGEFAGAAKLSGRVEIEITGRGVVAGDITWRADSSYGVMFDRQLARDHPVVVAAIDEQHD